MTARNYVFTLQFTKEEETKMEEYNNMAWDDTLANTGRDPKVKYLIYQVC